MDNESIKDRINAALATAKDPADIERAVWEGLPEGTRERLGHVRLRQLIAIELNDPDQLEIAFDGERLPVGLVPPDVLERKGGDLLARADGLRRRGEAYLAEARRRRELEG